MLMPLSIDMYLPARSNFSAVWCTGGQYADDPQYLYSGLCVGAVNLQRADSEQLRAWPVVLGGTLVFAAAAVACALAQTIDQLIVMRFLPRAGCGCGQRGYQPLMRDIYPKSSHG